MNTEVTLADRRRHSRIELSEWPMAAISGQGDNLAVRAEVLDISLGGARVKIDRAISSDRNFVEFMIDGVKAIAEIVWHSATEIGLRYVEQAGDAAVNIFERLLTREYGRSAPVAS